MSYRTYHMTADSDWTRCLTCGKTGEGEECRACASKPLPPSARDFRRDDFTTTDDGARAVATWGGR